MNITSTIDSVVIIGVITALVEIVKRIPFVEDNKRWCPSISVLFGLFFGVLAGVFLSGETEIPNMIFVGLGYGLAACGLYSFGNQFVKG